MTDRIVTLRITKCTCPFSDRILVEWWPGANSGDRRVADMMPATCDAPTLLMFLVHKPGANPDRLATLIREALEEGERLRGETIEYAESALDAGGISDAAESAIRSDIAQMRGEPWRR